MLRQLKTLDSWRPWRRLGVGAVLFIAGCIPFKAGPPPRLPAPPPPGQFALLNNCARPVMLRIAGRTFTVAPGQLVMQPWQPQLSIDHVDRRGRELASVTVRRGRRRLIVPSDCLGIRAYRTHRRMVAAPPPPPPGPPPPPPGPPPHQPHPHAHAHPHGPGSHHHHPHQHPHPGGEGHHHPFT